MKPKLSLKGRALQLLAQREHSRVELRQKLTRHAASAGRACRTESDDADRVGRAAAPAETARDPAAELTAITSQVDELLEWLESNRLASDERFVESRVNARLVRFGNLRIRDELSRHGVAPSGEMAQRLKDSELQRAGAVWSTRFGAAPQDAATHARQYRFLAGRGFSPEAIRQTLRLASRQDRQDAPESAVEQHAE